MIPELSSNLDRLRPLQPRQAYREIARALGAASREGNVSVEAQRLLELVWFDVEVSNGGLLQYFTNPRAANYTVVLDMLQECGLDRHKSILARWFNLLPNGVNPADSKEVGRQMFSNKALTNASGRLDMELYGMKDEYYARVVSWAIMPDQDEKASS
jgi:hypothetical protein